MCGLVGFIGSGSMEDLERMTRRLAHRGPDGEGLHWFEELHGGIGHRRLAIRDLESGAQPMWNEDRTVAVVYNGEIYDASEMRRVLESHGHRFATDHCDTEILVHGWEEWGEDLPRRINGMFAFAVVDLRRDILFLARDRFGEKPLYYARQGDLTLFASECSPLLAHPEFKPALDPVAIQRFFAWGYLPAPQTLYREIHKVEPGAWIRQNLKTGDVRREFYWKFMLDPDASMELKSEMDLEMELRSLMDHSVTRRLVSDVPIGLFLSGGLDSAVVLESATRSMPRERIRTFTIGFEEASFDESEAAREVAQHFGVHHEVQMLRMADAVELIPQVLGKMDEPLVDGSILPTWLLSRFTRQHVTVALSGDGGDELLAGYDPFAAFRPAAIYRRLVPSVGHRAIEALMRRLPKSGRNMSLDFKLRRTLMGLRYPPEYWCPVWMGPLDPRDSPRLFPDPLPMDEIYRQATDLWHRNASLTPVERSMEFFTRYYLTEDILLKVDRASMMTSLETRAAFLDNDLVDFCRRLPIRFKMRRGIRKYLMRRAWRETLPMATLNRPKKGFGIPVAAWLRRMPWPGVDVEVPGLDSDAIRAMWEEHRTGRADHRFVLWGWLSLQGVLRNHGDAKASCPTR